MYYKGKFKEKVIKTEEKQFKKLSDDLDAIKKLLVLLLKKNNEKIRGDLIAKALGISEGRLSQIFPQKRYKKSKSK